jgi:hypothetical protein
VLCDHEKTVKDILKFSWASNIREGRQGTSETHVWQSLSYAFLTDIN